MKKQLTADQVDRLNKRLHTLVNGKGGVTKFLSKVTSPLRQARDLISGVRKVFLHDPLGQGDVPTYDIDPKAYAFVIPNQSGVPRRMSPDEYRQISYPVYDTVVFKEFPTSQVRRARYNFLKRIEQVLRNALVEAEDNKMFEVLASVVGDSAYPHTPVAISATTGIQPGDASTMYGDIEDRMDPAYFIGRASNFSSLRTWGVDIFAPVRREEVFKTGIIGYVWNAAVYKSRFAPAASVFCTGDPEFLGRVPEFGALQPMEAAKPRDGKTEMGMVESIGIGCHNPFGVTVGNIS